ncbi:MAG: lipid-A-disaccharide synthase [Deltaproteobacteria bacterium]|nr:lipid-A-disaccharide synthase [Deltaproteobacteria bacterium]
MNNIFIVSGEESGDLHGASLIAALKKIAPEVKVAGMGGRRMKEAGLTGPDSKEVSVVGIVEVLEKLPTILKRFKDLKAMLEGGNFDAVVLIDFPDFNLRFAKDVKKLGIPIIYYISPQVWAWRKKRINKIAALVDKMLVVFPFEEALYKAKGVDVEYVGHPLADIANCDLTMRQAREKLYIPQDKIVISLLPGSRTGEIKRLLAPMLTASGIITKELGENKPVFLLPAANSIDDSLINEFLKDSSIDLKVVRGQMYTALRASDASIVTSGTATLETALIGTPMVIIYKMSSISFGVAKLLIDLKYAGLPNIVAGKKAVPELIQSEATPENMAKELLEILRDKKKKDAMIKDYKRIKKTLGGAGAANRAAAAINKVISQKRTNK